MAKARCILRLSSCKKLSTYSGWNVKFYVSLRSTEATDLEVRRTRGKGSRNVFRSVVAC